MANTSALSPVDPATVQAVDEDEKSAPWIVRKLAESMTGRIALSSYESLRAAGTSVVCLSPGGMAAVAAPVMVPVSELAMASFGNTILVELTLAAGFSLTTKVANDLVFSKPLNKILPIHSKRLETTAIKELLITLKLKLAMEDAQLGFFRSPIHGDPSLFSSVKDYLSIEKGWFSPYLFASVRRPVIPRTMTPDIVFCHGPFLAGDYSIGETLLAESASIITLCNRLPPTENGESQETGTSDKSSSTNGDQQLSAGKPNLVERLSSSFSESLQNLKLSRSRSPSPTGIGSRPSTDVSSASPESNAPGSAASSTPPPPGPSHPPRHMVLLVVGLKPHRSLWTTSKRPGESVMRYILLNGCVSIVVPVKPGAPLVAWDTLTLERLWEVELPPEDVSSDNGDGGESNSDTTDDQKDKKKMKESKDGKFEGIVQVLFEYLDLCVDWDRVVVQGSSGSNEEQGEIAAGPDIHLTVSDELDTVDGACDVGASEQADYDLLRQKKDALKDAVALLVASAVRSRSSEAVKKGVDADRAGVAMWRIR